MIIQEKVHLGMTFAKKGEGGDIQDGDKLEILDAGQIIKGEFGQQTIFKVKTRNGEKGVSFNQTSLNGLVRAFGQDSEKWKGKTVNVSLMKETVSGKRQLVMRVYADGWKITEDANGYVVIVPEKGNVKVGGVDGIDYPTETIHPEDIPFD